MDIDKKKKLGKMSDTKEYDMYRDSYVRYLGYANELGECFRALVHRRVVTLSYAAAFGYTIADVADKAWKAKKKTEGEISQYSKIVTVAADAFIWQTLASVAIPGYVMNRICTLALLSMKRYTKLPSQTRKWTTAVVGIAIIPIIIHPIDDSVSYMMDHTYRKIF